jgi:hypothetical protein
MTDPIERLDALNAIEKFRKGVFHSENLRLDNKHDWEAAYTMHKLYDSVYRIPKAKALTAHQKVKYHPWSGEYHTCSNCGKLVPFIDWCQDYCSGCGAKFRNSYRWCRKGNNNEQEVGEEKEGGDDED